MQKRNRFIDVENKLVVTEEKVKVKSLSPVWLIPTPWTVAH